MEVRRVFFVAHVYSWFMIQSWDYENPLVSLNKAYLLGPAISWGGLRGIGGVRASLDCHDSRCENSVYVGLGWTTPPRIPGFQVKVWFRLGCSILKISSSWWWRLHPGQGDNSMCMCVCVCVVLTVDSWFNMWKLVVVFFPLLNSCRFQVLEKQSRWHFSYDIWSWPLDIQTHRNWEDVIQTPKTYPKTPDLSGYDSWLNI